MQCSPDAGPSRLLKARAQHVLMLAQGRWWTLALPKLPLQRQLVLEPRTKYPQSGIPAAVPSCSWWALLYELAGLASGLLEGGKELGRIALRYPMQILQVSCCVPLSA